MLIQKKHLLFFIIFFTYLGYYTLLLTVFNLGQSEFSRFITVPLRLLISVFLIILFFKTSNQIVNNKLLKYFLLFVLMYSYRIFTEVLTNKTYYLDYGEVTLYFFSFVVIPFFVLSRLSLNKELLNTIFKAFSISALLFSILSIGSYSKFVGKVSRLSTGSAEEAVISPLALSYCSALIIGIFGSYLLFNKVTKKKRILYIGIIISSLIPYFLGSSRGSLIALLFPIIFLIFSRKGLSYSIKGAFFLIIGVLILIYLDSSFNSGLVQRILSLESDLQEENTSVIRIKIWRTALNQFIENPFLGDKLSVNNWESHPHNIIVETLMTTGFLGFFPFFILLFNGFKAARYIFKRHIEYAWIPILFLQNFFQNMFSGALHSATWLFTSFAILLSAYEYLKNKKTE